jgi:hypothetical protein
LFGSGLGQSGSNLNLGADGSCAAAARHRIIKPPALFPIFMKSLPGVFRSLVPAALLRILGRLYI